MSADGDKAFTLADIRASVALLRAANPGPDSFDEGPEMYAARLYGVRTMLVEVLSHRVDSARGWGVWGGRPPGGWASLRVAGAGTLGQGYDYCGTLAEAEAGAAVLARENPPWREGCHDCRYEVVPYDPARDPIGVFAQASDAQLQLLDYVRRFGDTSRLPQFGRSTRDAVFARGWVTYSDGRCRLTKVGAAVLEAGRGRLRP